MWFIDKNTREKVTVVAEKIENGQISFFYQDQSFTFSEEMLGSRIFVLKELFYKGEYYTYDGHQWVSYCGYVPKETYQKKLSQLYQDRYAFYRFSAKELISFAKKQDTVGLGLGTAIRTLEIAVLKASDREAKYFLPTLCSLYRKAEMSNAAISLYYYVIEKYGSNVESAPLLTSVSAAFMDVGNISVAERLKGRAFLLNGGTESSELSAFNQRFYQETRLE